MIGILAILAILYLLGYVIQSMAEREILWVIIPVNCFVFETTRGNTSGDLTQGGGGVVNIHHNVPGHKLVKKGHDLMEWRFIKGRESRGLLYHLLGVQWIGPFRTLRTNKVRRFRYVKRREEESGGTATRNDPTIRQAGDPFADYSVEGDDLTTKYVPFSGDQAIPVTGAETIRVFKLNFLLNIMEENIFPLKALRAADPNSMLAGMIKEKVNSLTGENEPGTFLKASEKSTKELVAEAQKAAPEALKQVGKDIVQINLVSTSMSKEDSELFELEERTNLENAAAISKAKAEIPKAEARRDVLVAIAQGESDAKKKHNEADADRVTRVLLPMSETQERVAVYQADAAKEAYLGNKTVTTYAPGSEKMVPVGK